MAISSGVNPNLAWLSANGMLIPVLEGSAEQMASRESSTFSATVPINFPGALGALSTLGENESGVIVQSSSGPTPLVMGEIDSVEFKFGESGTITASGRCKSVKLHAKKSSQKWVNKKTTEIVQDVAGQAGLGTAIDSGTAMAGKIVNIDHAKMTDGISLAAVIHKLAMQDGARWWVDPQGTLHYKIGPSGGGYSLNYFPGPPESADFFELTVKRNVQAGKGAKVTVKSWHPKDKKVNQATATAGGTGGGGTPLEYNYHIPNLKQDQAQQHAESRANAVARQEITIHARCVGDPSIDVGTGLNLSGTGAFDGPYDMESVHHSFGMSGHTMEITAKTPSQSGGGGGGGAGA